MMNRKINKGFIQEGITNIKDDDVEIVMENEDIISNKINNASPLRKFAKIGKIMFEMLKDITVGRYTEVPWFTIGSIAFALLYILNPLDLIPDFIPGIGYIDDLAVMTVSVGWIETDLHKYLDWRIDEAKA